VRAGREARHVRLHLHLPLDLGERHRPADRLAGRGVEHEKTPEKVIFAPAVVAPSFPGAEAFAGFDPAMLAGLSQEDLLGMAQAAMQQMGPDQLAAMRAMFEGMTPEEQAALIEQARKLGLG
jgi:hypothetical protein